MLGAQCAQLRGPLRAPLRRVPFHSRLGNWPSDTTTAAIAGPQELGPAPPNAHVPFSILSFSFLIFLIGVNGTLSQG